MSPKKVFWLVVTALLLALHVVYLVFLGVAIGESTWTDTKASSLEATGGEAVERVVVIPSSNQVPRLPKCLVEDSYFYSLTDYGWISSCDEFLKNPPLKELQGFLQVLEPYKGTLEAIEVWTNTMGQDGRVAMSLILSTTLYQMGYNIEQIYREMGVAYPVNEVGMLGQNAIVIHFPDEDHGLFYHIKFKSNAGLANFLNTLRMESSLWQ